MLELRVRAEIADIAAVTAAINELLEKHDCNMKAEMQIDVAVDEILTNIASYAYGEKRGEAEVRAKVEDGFLTLEFRDRGIPFDPMKAEEPDTTKSAMERRIGGLGIFIVKKTMDEVRYRFENGQNVLTIRKRIN